jgi:chemotaxis protein CheC
MTTQSPSSHLTMRRARQLEAVHRIVCAGVDQASKHLSIFVGRSFKIEAPRLGICPVEDLTATALGSAFDEVPMSVAESVKTGIYLSIGGDIEGHFLMLLAPDDARSLVAPLLHDLSVPLDMWDELTESALGEVGNITSSSVLNALADATHLRIGPSCPAIVTDMAGAILEMPMIDIAQYSDEALYIDTTIKMSEEATPAILAIIPNPEGLDKLIEKLDVAKRRRA